MKEIQLSKGQVALVDDDKFEELSTMNWHASYNKHTKSFYAQRNYRIPNGPQRIRRMHRHILGVVDPSIKVDHKNGNTLDNQVENLRLSTNSQNCSNARLSKRNTSGYKGTYWDKTARKWTAKIRVNSVLKFLGYFPTIEETARAYDAAAVKYFGEFARLNFKKDIL